MIGKMISGLLRSLTDIAFAGWHIATRQTRNRYSLTLDVAAPAEALWSVVTRRDITFSGGNGMRSVMEPIEGRENALVSTMTVGKRQVARVAFEVLEREPPVRYVARYLPELSDKPEAMGEDDRFTMSLAAAPAGGTRMTVSRELSHRLLSTRISAPIGVRVAAHLFKSQAEAEAGRKPAIVSVWLQQALWSIAAIASFWLMFGLRDAVVIAVVVAVHEAGHAAAMLRYGLGVRVMSFVPFFGGVAVPRRFYASQWQRGIVALMGVGLSLPPTLALLWAANEFKSNEAAHWAALSAFINGFNLLPIPGLDGSIVTQLLLRRAPAVVGRAVALLFFGALILFAANAGDIIIWIGVAFSLLVMVQSMSLKIDEGLPALSWQGALALLMLFGSLLAGHVLTGVHAVALEDQL